MSIELAEVPPASCFLPGTKIQYAWDSTSLGLLKTCPRLYQYIMIEGWSPDAESVHLRFGIEYHSALQDYDISRAQAIPHDDAVHDTVRALLSRTHGWEVDETQKAGKYKNRRSLLRSVLAYLDHFRDDPAKTFILADGRPAVELSFRFELDWGPRVAWPEEPLTTPFPRQPYLLAGHLDRVVTFQDFLFGMDRKTTTTTPGPYYFNQFEPNNQMTLYTLASKVILGSPIKGIIIDAVQILIDSNRFVRGFTYRSPDQLEEWTHDLSYHLSMAEGYAANHYWPMNDTACDKFGGCRFREICSKSPQVREKFLRSGFTQLPEDQRWNPLKSRM